MEAAIFGFYTLCGKSAAIMGPLVFGGISHAAGGNQRAGILAIGSFFLVGLVLLSRVRAGGPTHLATREGGDMDTLRDYAFALGWMACFLVLAALGRLGFDLLVPFSLRDASAQRNAAIGRVLRGLYLGLAIIL